MLRRGRERVAYLLVALGLKHSLGRATDKAPIPTLGQGGLQMRLRSSSARSPVELQPSFAASSGSGEPKRNQASPSFVTVLNKVVLGSSLVKPSKSSEI